jgi:hypothetical protein
MRILQQQRIVEVTYVMGMMGRSPRKIRNEEILEKKMAANFRKTAAERR